MHSLRTIVIISASLIMLSIGSFAQAPGTAAPSRTKAAAPSQVQVDLLRGLADIFSRGMDTLAAKLNQQGYSAQVYSTNGWQSVAHRIADKYSRGHRDIIVIIGHSLGGNAAFDIANQLTRTNIPNK